MTFSWEYMEDPVLGFRNIHIKNLDIYFKWWWKYAHTCTPLRKQAVKSNAGIASQFPYLDHDIGGPLKDIKTRRAKFPWMHDI